MKKSWDTLPIFVGVALGLVFLFAYHGPHQELKIAVFFALFLSLFFWNGWRNALIKRRLQKEGLEGTARLLQTVKTGFRSGNDPEMKLTLAVTGQEGETWEASVRRVVLQNELYAMAPGTVFDVLYDPRDHSKVVLNARSRREPAAPGAFFQRPDAASASTQKAPLFPPDDPASVQAFQEIIARQDAVQKRLLPRGILAPAKVVSCAPLHATMNHRDPLVMLMLEVQPETDPVFLAQANVCLDATRLDHFAPGCIVYVKYDPADKSEIALVGSEKPS